MEEQSADEKAVKTAQTVVGGCGILGAAAILFALFYVISWLNSCGSPAPPSPEEMKRLEQKQALEEERQAAFEKAQLPLWNTPATTMTKDQLVGEIAKCQEDIKRKDGSPYAWSFDGVDLDAELSSMKAGGSVSLVSQNRKDSPLSADVELAKYHCSFRGAGYESFRTHHNTHYTTGYLPQ